ncbi:hypothetical protein HPB50_016253 [Hyalomma asiaticum]|uniref:Uncharacterized protein n=1 Tax=Hyalomma asiaticum TaxID=266040 RepID=A0ACB7TJ16_HYAAI|nr:hypothetical protein HPB50_016253 [Hyalomma asiaticum]
MSAGAFPPPSLGLTYKPVSPQENSIRNPGSNGNASGTRCWISFGGSRMTLPTCFSSSFFFSQPSSLAISRSDASLTLIMKRASWVTRTDPGILDARAPTAVTLASQTPYPPKTAAFAFP